MSWQNQRIRFHHKGIALVSLEEHEQIEGTWRRLTNVTSNREGSLVTRHGIDLVSDVAGLTSPATLITRLEDPVADDWTLVVQGGNRIARGKTMFTSAGDDLVADTPASYFIFSPLLLEEPWIFFSRGAGGAIEERAVRYSRTGKRLVGIQKPWRFTSSPDHQTHVPAPTLVTRTPKVINAMNSISGWVSKYGNDDGLFTMGLAETVSEPPIDSVKPTRSTNPGLATTLRAVFQNSDRHLALLSFIPLPSLDLERGFNGEARVEMFINPGDPERLDELRVFMSLEPQRVVTAASNTTPITITTSGAHGYANGDVIAITRVNGNEGANGSWEIESVTSTTFTLKSSGGTGTFSASPNARAVNLSRNGYAKIIKGTEIARALGGVQPTEEAARILAGEVALEDILDQINQIDQRFIDFRIEDTFGPVVDRFRNVQPDLHPIRTPLGRSQWFAFSIPKREFIRLGSSIRRDWSEITALHITVVANEKIVSQDFLQFFEWDIMPADSGLDSSLGIPYDWRYTYYNATSGDESNPIDIMPEGIDVVKRTARLTIYRPPLTEFEHVTNIRIYRRGGVLTSWHLVASVPRGDGPLTKFTFDDNLDDLAIALNPVLRLDNDRPLTMTHKKTNFLIHSQNFGEAAWVKDGNIGVHPNSSQAPDRSRTADLLVATAPNATIIQDPRPLGLSSGTEMQFTIFIKRKSGTGDVQLSTDQFATFITINPASTAKGYDPHGVWERFAFPSTNQILSQNVTWVGLRIVNSGDEFWVWGAQLENSPRVPGIPVTQFKTSYSPYYTRTENDRLTTTEPTLWEVGPTAWWGPFLGKWCFALQQKHRPGHVFWNRALNPDVWPPQNNLQVTGPGEPLVNGFLYNGRSYVFSTEGLYVLYPDILGTTASFISLETPCGVGLWRKHSFAVGPRIWFLAKDGIYETTGGQAQAITHEADIKSLFTGQQAGFLQPVNMNDTENELRLVYDDPFLWFFYRDALNDRQILRYHTVFQRWEHHKFTPEMRIAHREEGKGRRLLLGSHTGNLYTQRETIGGNDAGSPISCTVGTAVFTQGDLRVIKTYGDAWIEAVVPVGLTINIEPFVDLDRSLGVKQIAGLGGRRRYFIPLAGNVGASGRHITFNITWDQGTGDTPQFFEMVTTFTIGAIESANLGIDWTDLGQGISKYVWGLSIDVETTGDVEKEIHVQGDGTTVLPVQIVPRPVDTTTLTTVTPGVDRTVEVASMRNIAQGMVLRLDSGPNQEDIVVKSIIAQEPSISFKADLVNTHNFGTTVRVGPEQRVRRTEEFGWHAFKAKQVRLVAEDTTSWVIRDVQWYSSSDAPLVDRWDSNWDAARGGMDFYATGVELECDTQNAAKGILIERDGGTTVFTGEVTANGRTKVRLTWPVVKAKTLRIRTLAPFAAGRLYKWHWFIEDEPPSVEVWDSNVEDGGSLEDKWITGLYIEADTEGQNKLIHVEIDGVAIAGSPFTINTSGRKPAKISFGPNRGVLLRFHSPSVAGRLYEHRWIWHPEPFELTNFNTQWEDLGWPFEKFIKGISIEADTGGLTKNLQVRIDGNEAVSAFSFTINHPNRTKSFVAFPAQFLARTIRLASADSVTGRLYGMQFVWDREPIDMTVWQTQEESFNQTGYLHLKDMYVGMRSTAPVTLTVTTDGVVETYPIPSTGGERRKRYVRLKPIKGKVWKFRLESSAPFKLYLGDTNVKVKPWNSKIDYRIYQLPFSGPPENP